MLTEALKKLAADLRTDLGVSGSVTHGPTKGDLREEPLRKGLARHLPSQYLYTKGVVVNSDGEESLSQDVLIVDTTVAGPFVGEAVYPIESVIGTVQVKSTLRASDVAATVENVASVSRLVPEEYRSRTIESRARWNAPFEDVNIGPFTGVFAYVTDGDPTAVATAYTEENLRLPVHERVSSLCLLDVGVCLWASEMDENIVWFSGPSRHAKPIWVSSGEWAVTMFVMSLWEALIDYSPPPISPIQYLQKGHSIRHSFWQDDEEE